jgi:hypothetical protein
MLMLGHEANEIDKCRLFVRKRHLRPLRFAPALDSGRNAFTTNEPEQGLPRAKFALFAQAIKASD